MSPALPIYLDHNATTPVDPRVLAQMLPYLATHFGNPSSGHAYGRTARDAVELARSHIARLVGAPSQAITFTGSGSEANWLAIVGSVRAAKHSDRGAKHSDRRIVLMPATEHPSVLAACDALHRQLGIEVTTLPVDRCGVVSVEAVRAALTPCTLLVCVQLANGETGTIQPVADIVAAAHEYAAIVHVDAAQAAGKIPIDVDELGADLLTVVGHKMYGPKGVAALYHRPGVAIEPLVGGGGQEFGLRAGTENVASLVGLGAACDQAAAELASEAVRLRSLRDLLHDQLCHHLGDRVALNGHPTVRLPNTLNVSIDGTDGNAVLAATPDVAASTGAACHSGSAQPSPVLTAMGLTQARARSALRLSVGRWTTESEVLQAADALATAVRQAYPAA